MKKLIIFIILVTVIFYESEARDRKDKFLRHSVRELRREGWKPITDEPIDRQLALGWELMTQFDPEGYPIYIVKSWISEGNSVEEARDSALYYTRVGAIDDYNMVQFVQLSSDSLELSDCIIADPVEANVIAIVDTFEDHFAVNITTETIDPSEPHKAGEVVDQYISGYEPFMEDIQKCEKIILSLWRRKGEKIEVRIAAVYPIAEMKPYPVKYEVRRVADS